MELDLSNEELKVVTEILDDALSDLRMEIADTDSVEFRDMLKERKRALIKALDTLRSVSATNV